MRKIPVWILAIAFVPVPSHAQDSPSLGDLARQVRAQKQKKEAETKDTMQKATVGSDSQPSGPNAKDASQPKTTHVISDEEVPEHQPRTGESSRESASTVQDAANHEAQGEEWKAQIQTQKSNIAALQKEIDDLSNSIHYAGANCVANCAQWNERQQQKQQQVENMKAQLEEQQHHLEEMQETARKQGFGSSIYDP